MSVLTRRVATCDTCKGTQSFGAGKPDLPDGWASIMLFRRLERSRQLHHLDLCPHCQETALDALGKETKP